MVFIIAISVVSAFATETGIYVDNRVVKLSSADESFKIEIDVKSTEKFAGVELGVECSDNISLEKSSSSAGSMSASPVKSKGLYWTSFFESDNIMPENVTITLEFKCFPNTDLANVVIKEANILTKDGVGVLTQKLTPNIKIVAGVSENIVDTEFEDSTESNKKDENSTKSNKDYIDKTNAEEKESDTLYYEKSKENSADVIKTGQDVYFYPILIVMLISGAIIFFSMKKILL